MHKINLNFVTSSVLIFLFSCGFLLLQGYYNCVDGEIISSSGMLLNDKLLKYQEIP